MVNHIYSGLEFRVQGLSMSWGIRGGGVSKGCQILAALFLMGVLGHGSLKFDDHEQESKLLYYKLYNY